MNVDTPADLVKAFQNRPKTSLGQYFLTDPSILQDIADYGGFETGDRVLEVGAGCGTLSYVLLNRGAELTAVEFDDESADFLERVFGDNRSFGLRREDFLELSTQSLLGDHDNWYCVSNLPYKAATEIFFDLAEHIESFERLVLMFQKEVAERFCASSGDDQYGILSLMGQLYTSPSIVKTLPPGAFYPSPEVSSSLVVFEPVEGTRLPDDEVRQLFKEIVRAAFQQRRKMLRNSLLGLGLEKSDLIDLLESAEVDPRRRPEKLDFSGFVRIAEQMA